MNRPEPHPGNCESKVVGANARRAPSMSARRLARAAAVAITAAVLWTGVLDAVAAAAQRPHSPAGTGDLVSLPAGDYCEFAVSVEFLTFNQYVIQETTSPDGTLTQHITGHATALVTNLESRASLSLNISGPATVFVYSDGSFSADASGPNLLWTTKANSFPGVPPLSYTKGRVRFDVNASGLTTSYQLAGGARQTDICALLAAPVN